MAVIAMPASPTGNARRNSGFTLLEAVVAMALIAALFALVFPAIAPGTGRPKLEALALNITGLLKGDRNAALRRRADVVTSLDLTRHEVRSGSSRRIVRLPDDVRFDLLSSADGATRAASTGVRFYRDGSASGAALLLSRGTLAYEVRVNWFTGAVTVHERGS
jgi:general secretion pathway protein H